MRLFRMSLLLVLLVSNFGVAVASPGADELPLNEVKSKASKAIEDMRGRRDKAEAALRQARADRAMGRLDCVNEALIALKGVLKLAEGYLYDLQAESKDGNKKGANASFAKIKIAMKKVDDLDARLRSCGGPSDEGVVEGKPIIERIVDADLPTQDPLEGLESEAVFVESPPNASPYN
jgi:hypothetical protein